MSNSQREAKNRAEGLPCYCGSLVTNHCDFCTGLAPLDGVRAEEQIKAQSAHA